MQLEHRQDIIAAACHSAWYAYAVLGLGQPGQPWDQAPQWQRHSMLEAVAFWDRWIVEARRRVQAGRTTPLVGAALWSILAKQAREELPAQSHAHWMSCKLAQGWTWGPEKDPVARRHPDLVPYEELAEEERKKDRVVVEAYLAICSVP